MTDSRANIDVQIALDDKDDIPTAQELEQWVSLVLEHLQPPIDKDVPELTIRFVTTEESNELNHTYRGKDKPTNVLSFPYENMPGIDLPLLGDIVICPAVMRKEAQRQQKSIAHHYAHLVVHGVLHLLGYDHINDEEAEVMERLEVEILTKLGIDDPYQDKQ